MPPLLPLSRLQVSTFETTTILKAAALAGRQLAELKGLATAIPNQGILISTLGLQEAKDSSAIENIVTTHYELFRAATYPDLLASPAAKEVRHYVQALRVGFDLVVSQGLLTANSMIRIQAELEGKRQGCANEPIRKFVCEA